MSLHYSHGLEIPAHPNAPATKNTLCQVPDDKRIELRHMSPAPDGLHIGVAHPVLLCEGAERAFISLVADDAGRRMIRENEFQHTTPRGDRVGGMRKDLHSVGYGSDAGSQQSPGFRFFDQTEPTRARSFPGLDDGTGSVFPPPPAWLDPKSSCLAFLQLLDH